MIKSYSTSLPSILSFSLLFGSITLTPISSAFGSTTHTHHPSSPPSPPSLLIPTISLSYRTRDEVSNVRASRDPIDNARNRIFEAGFATPADIKQIDKEIKEKVDIAVEKAKASPQPPVHELYEHIYAGVPPSVVRDVELSQSVSPKH